MSTVTISVPDTVRRTTRASDGTPWSAVAPTQARAAYLQVADQIRAAIATGELTPGARLPNDSDLATFCAVGRATARKAVEVVRDEGLAYGVRGRGTFVHHRPQISARMTAPEAGHLVRGCTASSITPGRQFGGP